MLNPRAVGGDAKGQRKEAPFAHGRRTCFCAAAADFPRPPHWQRACVYGVQLLTEEHSVQVRQAIRDRRKAGRARHEGKEEGAEGEDAAGDGFLSERVSRRILETAREQAHELEAEALGAEVGLSREDLDAARRAGRMVSARASGGARSAGGLPPPRREGDEDDEEEEEEDEEEEEEEEEGGVAVDESGYVDAEGGAEEEDEELVRKFMSQSTQERRTLASALAERIRGEEEADTHRADAPTEESERKAALGITPKVERVYEEVGKFLATYRSGKLPKVFKVLPALDAWEEVRSAPCPPCAPLSLRQVFFFSCRADAAADEAGGVVSARSVRGDQGLCVQPERRASPAVLQHGAAARGAR
jgi:hypothetical protein